MNTFETTLRSNSIEWLAELIAEAIQRGFKAPLWVELIDANGRKWCRGFEPGSVGQPVEPLHWTVLPDATLACPIDGKIVDSQGRVVHVLADVSGTAPLLH